MSRHVPRWAALFLTLALASASFAAPAEVPFLSADAPAAASQIWVAWLDGRSLDQARSAGALLLDRFPDAVIVADAT